MTTDQQATSNVERRQVMPSVLDELLTVQQVAALLQMRQSTVEDYARRGLLPSLKLGRHRRFLRTQIERTIATLAEEHATPRQRALARQPPRPRTRTRGLA
jgi:excisionase family DNA binding protein